MSDYNITFFKRKTTEEIRVENWEQFEEREIIKTVSSKNPLSINSTYFVDRVNNGIEDKFKFYLKYIGGVEIDGRAVLLFIQRDMHLEEIGSTALNGRFKFYTIFRTAPIVEKGVIVGHSLYQVLDKIVNYSFSEFKQKLFSLEKPEPVKQVRTAREAKQVQLALFGGY